MKKTMLFFGVAIVGLFVVDYFELYLCHSYRCRESSDALLLGTLILSSISFLFVLFLSFTSEKLFKSWWKFARITLPIIFIISTLINLHLHHSPGGFFNMDDMFDIPALVLMYTIFIIGSCIQIWRGYRQK